MCSAALHLALPQRKEPLASSMLPWICRFIELFPCPSLRGTWCSGITSASHAEGPGLNPQCDQDDRQSRSKARNLRDVKLMSRLRAPLGGEDLFASVIARGVQGSRGTTTWAPPAAANVLLRQDREQEHGGTATRRRCGAIGVSLRPCGPRPPSREPGALANKTHGAANTRVSGIQRQFSLCRPALPSRPKGRLHKNGRGDG